jgi:hypothetical protein
MAEAKFSITLVHGTWGRGIFFPTDTPWFGPPYWFNPGSPFRRHLEQELKNRKVPYQIDCITWSGSNSVFERAAAATKLSEHLLSQPPGAPRVVIGHSHGGNIALKAIDKSPQPQTTIHVVSLATPFLRVYPTWEGPSYWQLLPTSYIIALVLILIFATAGAHYIAPLKHAMLEGSKPLMTAGLILFSMFLANLFIRFIFNPGSQQPPDKSQRPWIWRPFTLADATNYDFASSSAPPLLVIRGVGDEASLSMAMGKAGSRFSYIIAKTMIGKISIILMGALASLFMVPNNWETLPTIVNYACVIAGVTTVISLIMLCFANAVFGKEFLIGAMRCDVAADSVPDSASAKVVTLRPPDVDFLSDNSGLRHSLYNDPKCVSAIIAWLDGKGLLSASE